MVHMKVHYEGQLHCRLKHGPSGAEISTDAPTDNNGKGEAFSPTDLVSAGLAACILTTMGIVAQRHGIRLDGASAAVTKEMITQPERRIGRITVQIEMPAGLDAAQRALMEKTALACPISKSLHPGVETPVTFRYPD